MYNLLDIIRVYFHELLGGQGLGIPELIPVFHRGQASLDKRGHLGVLLCGRSLIRFIMIVWMIVWCYSSFFLFFFRFFTEAIGGGGDFFPLPLGYVGSSSKSTIRREQSKTRSGSSFLIGKCQQRASIVGTWVSSREEQGVGTDMTEAVVRCVYNLLFLECLGAWRGEMMGHKFGEREIPVKENSEQFLFKFPLGVCIYLV